MTADLVKCLSFSVPILLTDDSRLRHVYVSFCATQTNFGQPSSDIPWFDLQYLIKYVKRYVAG
jgi:hypothetical protein